VGQYAGQYQGFHTQKGGRAHRRQSYTKQIRYEKTKLKEILVELLFESKMKYELEKKTKSKEMCLSFFLKAETRFLSLYDLWDVIPQSHHRLSAGNESTLANANPEGIAICIRV